MDKITATAIVKTIVAGLGTLAGSTAAQKAAEAAISGVSGEGAKALFYKFKGKLDKAGRTQLQALKGTAEDTTSTEEEIEEVVADTEPHVEKAIEDEAFLAEIKKFIEDSAKGGTTNNFTQNGGIGNTQQNSTGQGHNIAGNYIAGDNVNADKKIYNIDNIDDANLS